MATVHRVLPAESKAVRADLNRVEAEVKKDGMRLGDQGPRVAALQRLLQSNGVDPGPVDGDFGPVTAKAVRAFQKAQGLPATGQVRGDTLAKLREGQRFVRDGFETAAHVGERGTDVLGAEQRLQKLGFDVGKVDGVFDAHTRQAVNAFRAADSQLPDGTGIIDKNFDKRLRAASQPGATPRKPASLETQTARAAAKPDGIHQGAKGKVVGNVQQHLKAAGFDPGPVDGEFGPHTAGAVKAFQRDVGLPASGHVDKKTWDRLNRAKTSLHVGDKGRDVKHVEAELKKAGVNPGAVDGKFDGATARAVKGFQHQHHLAETGALDAKTAAFLDKVTATPSAPSSSATRKDRVLEQFDRVPPKADYHRVSYRGVTLNQRTKEMCQRAEYIMRHKYGHKGFQFSYAQGSYHPGVAASSHTHDRGGAIDIRTRGHSAHEVDDMVRSLREAGFAAWSRGRGHDSFSPHIHGIAIGDRQAHPEAAGQVVDYFAGRNGLANNAHDADGRLGRHMPAWARRHH